MGVFSPTWIFVFSSQRTTCTVCVCVRSDEEAIKWGPNGLVLKTQHNVDKLWLNWCWPICIYRFDGKQLKSCFLSYPLFFLFEKSFETSNEEELRGLITVHRTFSTHYKCLGIFVIFYYLMEISSSYFDKNIRTILGV